MRARNRKRIVLLGMWLVTAPSVAGAVDPDKECVVGSKETQKVLVEDVPLNDQPGSKSDSAKEKPPEQKKPVPVKAEEFTD